MKHAAASPVQVSVEAETWTQVLKYEEEPVLTLSLRWPTLPDERASFRRIGRYYAQVSQLWKKRWSQVLYCSACQAAAAAREQSRPFRPWEASLDYVLTYCQNGLLSLYLVLYENTGGAHGITTRCGDTWELCSGTPRSLRSFFPSGSHPRRMLLGEAGAQIERRIASGESLYYSDWAQRLVSDFSPERFYLTPEGQIAFFYPLYTLAPYAEGIPVFTIDCPVSLSSGNPEKKSTSVDQKKQ